jgi:Ca2+-binding RTX toxin-like protein
MFVVSQGAGGKESQKINFGDAVIGNGGNDTVMFTDSDYLWWSGHEEGALLLKNTYTLGSDISNLILGEGAASARNGIGNRTSTGYKDALGSNLIIGNEFANILDGDGVGGKDQTGSGIDTLTGGSGDDLFVVSGYTKSTGNKWDVSAEKITDTKNPNVGKYELDLTKSTFTDSDYVLITDFESTDFVSFSGDLANYWIGAAPRKPGLVADNVTPRAAGLTEFGIYKAPTGLKDGPNLVAHILLSGWSLDPADLSPSNYAFTPNLGPISASKQYLGWGEFYNIAGSSFASTNVDQGLYVQKDSYASLVQIFLSGDNTFQGGSGNDTFNGYDGNDTLKGGAGNDTLIGGEGHDSLLGEAGADSLLGEAGFDTLLGGDDDDTLDGGAGRDSLLGEAGDDSLFGGSGGDFLDGGAGVNRLLGGDGNDTLVWSALNATMDGGAGINDLLFNSGATLNDTSFSVISNISRIALSDDADSVTLGSNAVSKGFTSINSNGGNDTLDASAINAAVTLSGGAGADSILGGSATDSLVGGADNDTLLGGGNGDTLLGEAGADSLSGGAGTDSLLGGVDNDTLLGEGENDTLLGEAGADSLSGGAGTDSLLGGMDNDTLLGEEGNDTLLGEAGADSILGGAGTDSLLGGADNDTLLGEAGSDTLLGEAGNDSLFGGADNDSLMAGTGTDTLLGEVGNDTLVADSIGSASMLGGNDNDSFLFSNGIQLTNNTVDGGSGIDTLVFTAAAILGDTQIAKISSVEVIQLSSLEGNALALGTRAQAAGISSIFGGISSDLISVSGMSGVWVQGNYGGTSTLSDTLVLDQGTNKSTLVGNDSLDAINYFSVTYASLLGNNTLTGGVSSTDYIQLTEFADIITDSSFSHLSGINKLIYSYGSNFFTLGEQAAAAFDGDTIFLERRESIFSSTDTIDLSGVTSKKVSIDATNESAGSIIIAGSFANTLIGGLYGDDLFIFNKGTYLQQANIVGGGGTDTLRINANAQIIDSDALSGVKGIEVLDIVGSGNKITLGDIPTVIATIVGGSGPNTIDAGTYNSPSFLSWNMNASKGSDSLLGGVDGNLFQIKNAANLQNSFITGNIGSDTVQLLSGAQTLGDSAFGKISSIEQLVLGSAANGNQLTLGATAASKGITTIVGGTSKDTIDASAFNLDIFIDAGAGTGARLIGSTTNTNTLIGGSAGGNDFILGSLGSNSILGGSNGLDTLTFTDTTTLAPNDLSSLSKIGTLKFNNAGNTVVLGEDALIAGIRTLVGGEGNDTGGDIFDTSAYGSAGVLFQITDQNYLANITTMVGGTGVDTVKFSRDGVSVTDEVVANLYNIDVLQTANGNNLFVLSDQFVSAGIDSIIGGTGKDTLDISDNSLYTPTPVSDVPGANSDIITFDATAGSGYTLFGTTNNFPYAKVIGGTIGGAVILDGTSLVDSDFANMFQANAKTLTMRTETGVSIEVGLNAKGSGLTRINMAGGDDQIDTRAFAGTLTVSGGGGNDLLRTSFAALSDLTFNGTAGDDTLQIVGSDARAITTLKGDFDALVLNAGNNFVVLGNDAGLSTIYGGGGYDTISMLSNSTGIHFVVDADKLGALSGFNSLNGGSGSDTLGFSSSPTGGNFVDTQFTRIGLRNLTGGSGGEIENLVTYSDPTTGFGGSTYTLGSISDAAGISKVFFHANDIVDASGRQAVTSKAMNFVFTDPTVIGTATITGTGQNDTLTAKSDVATNFTIFDADFADVSDLEIFVFENSNASSGVNLEIDLNVENSGITTFIGGTGSDTFDASGGGYTLDSSIVGGAGGDSIIGGSGKDALLGGEGSDNIRGGAGADSILGTSAVVFGAGEKDTLTGDGGKDSFILGDATNAYYNSSASAGDFVLITDFTAGDDIIQLKDLAAVNRPTLPAVNAFGYLFGDASPAGDIYKVGTFGAIGVNSYLYADTNKTGIIDAGDNLIAAINSTGGPLSTNDLNDSTIFKFV